MHCEGSREKTPSLIWTNQIMSNNKFWINDSNHDNHNSNPNRCGCLKFELMSS